jgi:hypothetical protein
LTNGFVFSLDGWPLRHISAVAVVASLLSMGDGIAGIRKVAQAKSFPVAPSPSIYDTPRAAGLTATELSEWNSTKGSPNALAVTELLGLPKPRGLWRGGLTA